MSVVPPNSTSILPSYYLWDSAAALAGYLGNDMTGFVFDFPPAPASDGPGGDVVKQHVILREVPKALIVQYPFAAGFHFALPGMDDTMKARIASQVGISDPNDAPLAMFAGLIHEVISAEVDTSGGAIDEAIQMVKDAISNAEQGNYYGMASQAISDAQAVASQNWSKADQNYYRVTVKSRQFVPVTTGHDWDTAFNTVKAAYQNGTSIADALQKVADAGVRPALHPVLATSEPTASQVANGAKPNAYGYTTDPSTSYLLDQNGQRVLMSYFQMLALYHRENEKQALQAVSDSAFPGYMASKGFGDPTAARLAWLLAAGSAPSSKISVNSDVLKAVLGSGVNRSGALDTSGGGISLFLLGGGALAGYLLLRRRRRR